METLNILSLKYKLNGLNDSHPKSDNVNGLNISLMNHQKTAIHHAEILESNSGFRIDWTDSSSYYGEYSDEDIEPYRDVFCNFGILACKVGSGKSFVALALVLRNPLLNFRRVVSSDRSNICYSFKMMKTEQFTVSTNLFLVPHNLFGQWKGYMTNHTNLDCVFISTKKEFTELEKDMNIYSLLKRYRKIFPNIPPNFDENEKETIRQLDIDSVERCDIKLLELLEKWTNNKVYLISSKMWNIYVGKWLESFNKKVSRIFIDEVHSIVLPNSYCLKCNFIWFITSSSKDIYDHRNIGFIRDTIDSFRTIRSTYKDYITIRNNDDYIDSSLLLPSPVHHTINCKSSVILNIFDGILSNEVKSMLMAEDIEGVVSHLGIKTVGENDIIRVLCSNLEKELDNAKMLHNTKMMMHYSSEQSKNEAIQRSQEKIASIESKIENVRQRIMEANIDPILAIDIVNPVVTACCKNKFELESITTYYEFEYNKRKSAVPCPMCRATLNIKALVFLGEFVKKEEVIKEEDSLEWKFEDKTKIENLTWILQNKIPLDKKILIFSEHEGNFNTISDAFKAAGRNNLSPVKGTINHISALITKYNAGEIPNLFLNAKYCGSGLNLEKSDVVIIMHRMTTENIKQVIGRAQRIGRTTQLEVYFLYNQNEC